MAFKNVFNTLINTGVKLNYKPWEIALTKKLNLITIVAASNVLLALIIYIIVGYSSFYYECIIVIVVAPLIILFNKKLNYVWALYTFYLLGFLFFTPLNFKMGIDSFLILLYFPMIISLVLIAGRKETLKHLIILLTLHVVFIVFTLYGLGKKWLYLNPNEEVLFNLRAINILFSFLTTITFIVVLVFESIKQEATIKKMLDEKNVLLAEVFHRVKNNMNIVTSLLNLKKNSSDSVIVKDALEECRNRVFSMALVHQNIYKTDSFTNLDLKEYIHDLMDELINSLALNENIEVSIACDDINLNLNHAVPFGLVLNELVTNSFKYAQMGDKKLRIEIVAKLENEKVKITVKDNGPGINDLLNENKKSLGLDLIDSLSQQMDGDYKISNDSGLVFELDFKLA